MKKNKTHIIIMVIILILISILFLVPTKTYAKSITQAKSDTGVIDPDDFEPPELNKEDTDVITNKASVITSYIGVLGVIVSIIALILIGIKFMMGSVEEKAEYKKSMIPYLIGVFVFFALTQLLNIIIKIVEGFNI